MLGAVYLTGDCVRKDISSAIWCFHRASQKVPAVILFVNLVLDGLQICIKTVCLNGLLKLRVTRLTTEFQYLWPLHLFCIEIELILSYLSCMLELLYMELDLANQTHSVIWPTFTHINFCAKMQGHAGAAIAYGSLLLRGQLLYVLALLHVDPL